MLREEVTEGAALERRLRVREVAGLLGVSTATVYKLCARGELGHVRVLNALRITRDYVRRFAGPGSRERGE